MKTYTARYLALALVVGCGGSGGGAINAGGDSGVADAGGISTHADSGSAASDSGAAPDRDSGSGGTDAGGQIADAGGGSGTVSGDSGVPFPGVASSWWIGAPDSTSTTVVYVFSKKVACGDLATPGWDSRIPNGTDVLEMKMFGTAPATFTVVTTATPAPGEAAVNYTLSSTSGAPTEQVAGGVTVTLSTLHASVSATGTFNVVFAAGSLTGTFNAVYCPGGHEP